MSSLHRKSKNNFSISTSYFVVPVVLLIIFTPVGDLLRKGVNSLFQPLVALAYNLDESLKSDYLFKSKKELVLIIEELSDEISRLEYLESENEALRSELASLANIEEIGDGVLGRIISRPGKTLYGTVLVDLGDTYDSVEAGEYVYAESGTLIGTVENVVDKDALVSLYSAGGRETNAYLVKAGISVVLVGRGNGEFEITLPRGVELAEDDVVVLEEKSVKVLATAPKKISSQSSALAVYLVRTPFSIKELSWLIIKE